SLSRNSWYFHEGYARGGQCVQGENITWQLAMHHIVLGVKASNRFDVDYINGNGLDNLKSNLRLITYQQNAYNMKPHKDGSSKFKGVYWDKERERWCAQIGLNGKSTYLGRFDCEFEAAEAYNAAALKHFKDHARLNII